MRHNLGGMAESEVCIVCGDQCKKDGRKMPWESESPIELEGQNQNLKNQLAVMLLVRNVLGLSQELLKSLLQQRGHPTCWGLKLCGPCRRLFQETYYIHMRLSKLNSEYESLLKTLKSVWQNSVDSCDLDSETEIRRCRNRTDVYLKLAPETLPKNVTVSQWIRQEVSKSNGVTKFETNRKSSSPYRARKKGKKTNREEVIQFDNIGKVESVEVELDEDESSQSELRDTVRSQDILETSSNIIPDTSTIDDGHADLNNVEVEANISHPVELDDGDTFDSDSRPDSNDDDPTNYQPSETLTPSKSNPVPEQNRIDVFSVPQPIKGETDFQCPLCPRISYSKCSCHGHILRAHYQDSRPFHCHLCIKQFKREIILRTHLQQYHNDAKTPLDDDNGEPKEFPSITDGNVTFETDGEVAGAGDAVNKKLRKCEICPKSRTRVYKSMESLEAHKKIVHMGISKPYVCVKCDKGFRLSYDLRHHMHVHKRQEKEKIMKQAHLNTRPTYCYQCNIQFKSSVALTKHLKCKAHSKESPYLCEFCTKGFMQRQSLDNHRAQEHYTEANLQPFECSYCRKILSSQKALDHHIRLIHTGKTLIRCEPCNLGFMYESFYQKHLSVVHRKEKPLLCTYCPKSFSSANHLQTHIRTHTGEKPFKCTTCGKEYSDRPTFRRHLETHGEKNYVCSVCAKTFKVWHSFRNHLKQHGITATLKSSLAWTRRDNKNEHDIAVSAPLEDVKTTAAATTEVEGEMNQSKIHQEFTKAIKIDNFNMF